MYRIYRNKKGIKPIGLFLGVLLCVFLAGCGCGGGGDDARTPVLTSPEEDVSPIFISQTVNDQNYVEGIIIPPLDLPVAVSGNKGRTYSIIGSPPFGLTFDPVNRILSGTPSGTGTEMVIYKVADGDDNTQPTDEDTILFTIAVDADTAPDFVSKTVSSQTQNYLAGKAITQETLPQAMGGNGELTYSINPVSPFGLMFDPSTRRLSGTPTSSGMRNITYKVVDGDDNTQATDEDTFMFRMTVNANLVPFFMGTIADQVYIEGRPRDSVTLPEAMGGNGELTYSLAPRPDGMTFNSGTRELSGLPTTVSSTSVTYTATDVDGDTADLMFNLIYTNSRVKNICTRTQEVLDAILAKIHEIYNTITCDAVAELHLASITELNLNAKEIPRLRADDFDSLVNLISLDLNSNDLSTLPENIFEGLSSLTELYIYNNGLNPLPENIFEGLSSLTHLNLSSNRMSTLPENIFEGLSSLTELYIYNNRMSTLPENIFEGLSSLTNLGLSNNDLTALPTDVFEGLSSLTNLGLSNNDLETLPEEVFDGLSSLRQLFLYHNSLETIPSDLFEGLSNLTDLEMDHNNDLTVLPPDVFEGLGNLVELGLNNIGLMAPSADLFAGLSNLTDLRLGGNNMASPPEDLFDGLSSLEDLTLGHNMIINLPTGLFTGLSSLTDLDLKCNMITTLPAGLSPSLTLDLRGNPIDDTPYDC